MPKPPNKAPIAKLTGPSAAIVGEPVTFDGSGSSDPDTGGGQVKSWAFDPGIGDKGKSQGNGQPSTFTLPAGYDEAADYDAVLSVFDKPNLKGSTSSSTLTVTVTAMPGEPVDCVLGEWALESAEPWGPCQPDGTQTRSETWTRRIVIEPANGGAECGPISETRTGQQACTYVPTPVDCALGEWRLESSGEWGPCRSNGTQQRAEVWVRDILTEPANGGEPCGQTTETRLGQQACTYVPPTGEGPNDFFNEMKARSECQYAYSLRSEGDIAPYRAGSSAGTVTYDPVQDAARFDLPSAQWSCKQLWLPCTPSVRPGQSVLIWDWQQGDFTAENGIVGYKQFQVRTTGSSSGQITFEIGSSFEPLSSNLGGTLLSRLRLYVAHGPTCFNGPFIVGSDGSYNMGTNPNVPQVLPPPTHLYNTDSIGPCRNYWLPRGAYGRFMLEMTIPGDGWCYVNYWAIDSLQKTIVQIYKDISFALPEGAPPDELKHFDYEQNSSTSTPRVGPAVSCYGRNVLVLQNLDDPSSYLRAPIPGGI